MTAPALEVREVVQQFGGVRALAGVDLDVPPGQVRGVIGPNGAGKTTLLNVLSGLQRPSAGRVACFGDDVTGWPPYRIARHAGIVRTFQTVRLFGSMSVFDNVLVAAEVAERRRGRSGHERAEAVVRELGLDAVREARVTTLSYGTRRKIEIARALVLAPRVLLLDEPAAGLNGAERAELGRLLVAQRERGLTIVLVEHQMDLVSSVCDELTVLDFGRVVCSGPPDRVVEDERVLEAYLGGKL